MEQVTVPTLNLDEEIATPVAKVDWQGTRWRLKAPVEFSIPELAEFHSLRRGYAADESRAAVSRAAAHRQHQRLDRIVELILPDMPKDVRLQMADAHKFTILDFYAQKFF